MPTPSPVPVPDAGLIANGLVHTVGGQVMGAAVAIAPVAVPFVLGLTAIAWVMRKFGQRSVASMGAGLGGGDRYTGEFGEWDDDYGQHDGYDYEEVLGDERFRNRAPIHHNPNVQAAYERGEANRARW